MYACNEDYRLTSPQTTRICQADAQWSGFAPSCECKNHLTCIVNTHCTDIPCALNAIATKSMHK